MKVLLPSNTTHTIKLNPRFYPTSTLSIEVIKEGYNTKETIEPTYINYFGVLSVTFDLIGVEQDRFLIEITENNNVVYNGKLFFTEQDTQDFKLTKDTYIYVE